MLQVNPDGQTSGRVSSSHKIALALPLETYASNVGQADSPSRDATITITCARHASKSDANTSDEECSSESCIDGVRSLPNEAHN